MLSKSLNFVHNVANQYESLNHFHSRRQSLLFPQKSIPKALYSHRVESESCSPSSFPREVDESDVVIVGGGPAGLSTAIRIKQLCKTLNKDLRVCLLEKGSQIGSHSLSGAILDPIALNELFPNWSELGAPLNTPVTSDHLYWLTSNLAVPLPTISAQNNAGNYIISLGELSQWLAIQAESLGVEIYPGFTGADLLYNPSGQVTGVAIGDLGIGKSGSLLPNFERGLALKASITVLAEGTRGSLTKKVLSCFNLDRDSQPQTYGLGLKEIWKVDPSQFHQGHVIHTIGWPMDLETWAGSFIYHHRDHLVSIGYVVGLDYKNPYLSPYNEFQRWKHHPSISPLFQNGKCLSYGARTINEGGIQSIPTLVFPGGLLVGCAAGFVNVPKIKGSHNAIKSGMLAAEAIVQALMRSKEEGQVLVQYEEQLKESWLYKDLYRYRNIRPAFQYGIVAGSTYAAIDWLLLKGREPWTFGHVGYDHEKTLPASKSEPISYPKPDGIVSFDLLTNLERSGTNHNDNQPGHLHLLDGDIPVEVNYKEYAALESRYCPAGVYEYLVDSGGKPYLQINAQNCLHCKCCDIKDPKQNINWVVPEGGGGPKYNKM